MIESIFNTFALTALVLSVAMAIGTFSALAAWWSNHKLSFFAPIVLLAVPPWYLAYCLTDLVRVDPLVGATLSLGICCSVYIHSIILGSLMSNAHKSLEVLTVFRGPGLGTVLRAVAPSLRMSVVPGALIVFAEVLADFGTVNYFGIRTVTMHAYNTWTSTWNFAFMTPVLLTAVAFGGLTLLAKTKEIQQIQDRESEVRPWFAAVSFLPSAAAIALVVGVSALWVRDADHVAFNLGDVLDTAYLLVSVLAICGILSLTALVRYVPLTVFYSIPGIVIGIAALNLLPGWPLVAVLPVAVSLRYICLISNNIHVAQTGQRKLQEILTVFCASRWSLLKHKFGLVRSAYLIGICMTALDVLRELPISMVLTPMDFSTVAMKMNYIAKTESVTPLGAYGLVLLAAGAVFSTIIIWMEYAESKRQIRYA